MALGIKNNISSVNSLRNLGKAQDSLSKSLERLSSGQKINRGADSPAGLVISENLRGQIAGIQQAIANSEISISMVQTAEGALTEVNNLLIQMRQLALAAANEGANDNNSLMAIQSQLDNALDSIDRVSKYTRFGDKPLLDGSHGITGIANGEGLMFLEATVDTRGSPVQGYPVTITQAPMSAWRETDFEDSDAEELVVTLTEGGRSVTAIGFEDETALNFANKLHKMAQNAGLEVNVIYNEESENLLIRHKRLGSEYGFQVSASKSGLLTDDENVPEEVRNGLDVQGSINGEPAMGRGAVLSGNEGNRTTDGLTVLYTGSEIGDVGTVSIAQNSLIFQVGGNRGQTVSVAIDDTSSSALARGIPNKSGFRNLADLDISSSQGAQDSLKFIDSAMYQLSDLRGRLGAFQKNTLESNVSTLRVSAENLMAAESSIRDTDIAMEIAEFTKNRILTETAAAASAQSNSLPVSSIMTLLREK